LLVFNPVAGITEEELTALGFFALARLGRCALGRSQVRA